MTEAQAKAMVDGFSARIPMRRMGTPDDIAKAVLFLAFPASGYMTGASMVVDGGSGTRRRKPGRVLGFRLGRASASRSGLAVAFS